MDSETNTAIERLLKIIAALRSPGGCPWDAAQTPESLKRYIVEEAHELLEAIDEGDPEAIRDELGDLLLQVVLQARIFEEKGMFAMKDVAEAIAEKLVRRHPHVFGAATDITLEALELQWEKIKSEERGRSLGTVSIGIPLTLPALSQARKAVEKIRRTQTGEVEAPPDPSESLNTFLELLGQNPAAGEEALGRLLFHLVQIATEAEIDAEDALRRQLRKIIREKFSQDTRA